MIRYQLVCSDHHEFEGWFRDSEAFERQKSQAEIPCPACGNLEVEKALMAPALHARKEIRSSVKPKLAPAEIQKELKVFREKVLEGSTDVGKAFPEEARAMYYDEKPKRQVHGEATGEEVKALVEEGVPVLPLPPSPNDLN